MKTTAILAFLALSPALLAAEPNPVAPAPTTKDTPLRQEEIADQAALVQQIGEEAARGFDPEAHAHILRMQIEALASSSAAPSAGVLPKPATEAPSLHRAAPKESPAPPPAASFAPVQAKDAPVRETMQKLRSVLDEFESQLNQLRTKH